MTFKPLHFFAMALAGWMNREQQDVIAYLREKTASCGKSSAKEDPPERVSEAPPGNGGHEAGQVRAPTPWTGQPKVNRRRSFRRVPARTAQSDALSKDLKQRGFNFVGSTICYAFMQAVGMVNDHLLMCFRHGCSGREARRATR